ncbi:Zn-dependent hydrolase [Aureimonas sp. Leaf454]|uniref:MBL fold metallo-hydrolase n=1 Tax=Aureimonas sp. Leaf454 TaxID=1736381 RepID=UPI0006F7D060|nr:MBL fold metallo-hydrolase [Aureimonas sp. Leaf454]KQT54350.1 Zn-dependent hydrolase [Aureimonas sp. Leaf454]
MRPCLVPALLVSLFAGLPQTGKASAQGVPSTCHAIADAVPKARYASFDARPSSLLLAALGRDEVRITYAHHSTYIIESPNGVTAATDYSGFSGEGPPPRIATMNKAHSTHFTNVPDPAIETVLRGWNPDGGPARHAVTVDDLYVRNVPTDIRMGGGDVEADGNSIFVFEVAGLCIGHLGHLHHRLTDEDFADIGRLDIVMVPVDGSWTLSQAGMGETVERLRSQIVLPMHRFAGPIERFLERLPGFAVERRDERSLTVSMRTLPERPTVIILDGV